MEINGKNYNINGNKTDINFHDLEVNDEKIKNIFDHFDTNKDGKLSKQELDNIFSIIDNDSNKKLTEEELVEGVLALPKNTRIPVDAMKTFLAKLITVNNGKVAAQDLQKQINGASWYKNTLKMLKNINKDNVVEVWNTYSNLSKDETLASAIDNEIMLDVEDAKEFICKPLVERAKQAGVKCNDYKKLNNINKINNFIKSTIKEIEKTENNKLTEDLNKDLPFDPTDYPQYDNVMYYVKKGAKSHGNNLSDEEVENITKMILRMCKKYDILKISPLIAQILNTETGGYFFEKKAMDPELIYKGVMQVDYETCCCTLKMREPLVIFKKTYGNKPIKIYEDWHNRHFTQDDANIEKIKEKYPTPSKLYEAIKTDVELGLELGIIAFKAKLSQAGGKISKGVGYYCGENYSCDLSKIPQFYDISPNKK